jgi:hypothetical protein
VPTNLRCAAARGFRYRTLMIDDALAFPFDARKGALDQYLV